MLSAEKSFTAIENIEKRFCLLLFVLSDHTSSFQELLNDGGIWGIRILILRLVAIEVY